MLSHEGAHVASSPRKTYPPALEVRIPRARLTVTLDPQTLQRLDRWVDEFRYASRSQAIEAAVEAYIDRMDRRQPSRRVRDARSGGREEAC